ncbi:MAG: TonB-dependent receptor [Bacteroidetes bacterium]|nr:TonB-dependent receptor [Bacteroidota bacterium]
MRPQCIVPVVLLLNVIAIAWCDRASAQADTTQVRTSVLRGSVRVAKTLAPVIGARISVTGTTLGAVAKADGSYRISNIPVGHYILKVTALGFDPAIVEAVVGSGHQSVVDIEMTESAIKGDTITVQGSREFQAINSAAVVSVTPFSIQDVNRYAAAFQDPSRMANNFAGVLGRGTTNNYIVVRGGSPMELLWRLDGIDILNPNHLGKNGSTGGLVSAINSNMLGNSDFLTGAFPAQYGTKMSAVFDLRTRDGNTERYEGLAEISFNGLEGMAEGPVPGLNGSSFVIGYRHSTLDVLHQLGILDYNTLPNFDDAMAKVRLRVSDNDLINLTGLWGKASIDARNTSNEEIGKGSGVLAYGLDWQHLFSSSLVAHLLVNHSGNTFDEGISGSTESVSIGLNTARFTLLYLPTPSFNVECGAAYQPFMTTIPSLSYPYNGDTTINTTFAQGYVTASWHPIAPIALNAGMFWQYIDYDTSSSFEPRASISWSPSEEHSFALAYGIHRQPQPLQFTQAEHIVAGYTFRPESDLLFKAEAYVKNYSHVPVHASVLDDYSFLNEGFASRIDYTDLMSTGTGKTYGAEFTFMKHYNDGYYITATASYVRQQFRGSDGILHWGAFDNRYIMNLVGGYDFHLGASTTLTLSEKFTVAGGGAYTPFVMDPNDSARFGMLDEAHAYSLHNPAYVRLDVNAEFHFNWAASSLTIYASVLNALNINNVMYRYFKTTYDELGNRHGEEVYDYDLPIVPVVGLRYEF